MTDTPATPPPAPSKWNARVKRIAAAVIAVVAVVVVAIRVYDFFVLPACDADRVKDALTGIFKETGAEVKAIADLKPLTDASSPRECAGHVDATNDNATFEYQVMWDGWSSAVKVTKVTPDGQGGTGN